MGLNRTMKLGETLYLQRGEEVIAFHIHEFTQAESALRPGELIKVNILCDAERSWEITHYTRNGQSLKGKKPNATHQRSNQEKVLSQYEFIETPEEAIAKRLRQDTTDTYKGPKNPLLR